MNEFLKARYKNTDSLIGESAVKTFRPFTLIKGETAAESPTGYPRALIRITTTDVDRTNDKMNPRGIRLENFLKNPVSLWNHDHSIPCIANMRDPVVTDTYIDMWKEFHLMTPLSVEIANMTLAGFHHAESIGFIPLRKGTEIAVTPEMIASRQAYPGIPSILTWEESELLESSSVNVGMNQSALVRRAYEADLKKAVQQGVIPSDAEVIRMYESRFGTVPTIKTTLDTPPAEPETPPTPEPTENIPPINPQSEKTMIEEAISQIEATGKTTVGALMEESDNYDNEACDILEALALITVKACKAVAMNTATPEVVKVAGTIQKQLAAALVTLDALTSDAPVPEAEPETTEPEVTDPTELSGEKSVNKAGRAISTANLTAMNEATAQIESGISTLKGLIKSVSAEPEKSAEIIPLSSIRANFLNSL